MFKETIIEISKSTFFIISSDSPTLVHLPIHKTGSIAASAHPLDLEPSVGQLSRDSMRGPFVGRDHGGLHNVRTSDIIQNYWLGATSSQLEMSRPFSGCFTLNTYLTTLLNGERTYTVKYNYLESYL